jgi:hypothetical protein
VGPSGSVALPVIASGTPAAAKQLSESFQRHRFAFPYPGADAISNVIDVFEVEAARVGALDRIPCCGSLVL